MSYKFAPRTHTAGVGTLVKEYAPRKWSIDIAPEDVAPIGLLDLRHPTNNNRYMGGAFIQAPWGQEHCDWVGVKSKEEAREVFSGVWEGGAERVDALKEKLTGGLGVLERRRVGVWADQGEDLSVDRALAAGFDQAWRSSKRRPMRGSRQVRIFCELGGSGFLTSEELMWPGAAACALADHLENQGVRVELAAGLFVIRAGAEIASIAVSRTVKAFNEPLNPGALACFAGHSVTARMVYYQAETLVPDHIDEGFGRVDSRAHDHAISAGLIGPNDIFIAKCHSERAAVEVLKSCLAALDKGEVGE